MNYETTPKGQALAGGQASISVNVLHCPIDDIPIVPIEQWFSPAHAFIATALRQGNGNVFVHCQAGQRRSASIVIAAMILGLPRPGNSDPTVPTSMSLHDAFTTLRSVRPSVGRIIKRPGGP
jgi:hypothetical protein